MHHLYLDTTPDLGQKAEKQSPLSWKQGKNIVCQKTRKMKNAQKYKKKHYASERWEKSKKVYYWTNESKNK